SVHFLILKLGQSLRITSSESRLFAKFPCPSFGSIKTSALDSRGDASGDPPRKNLEMVAGIDAVSNTRFPTVPGGIHGEIRIAGTRTPSRSNLKGCPVP